MAKIISWVEEIKYLGIFITSAVLCKCNMHSMKFYRALNDVLGKVGTKSSVVSTSSLVSSFENHVLLFGLETGCLCRLQIDKLSHTFNAIYMKLFGTFDKTIIIQSQFYSYQLPLKHLLHLQYFTSCNNLRLMKFSPC